MTRSPKPTHGYDVTMTYMLGGGEYTARIPITADTRREAIHAALTCAEVYLPAAAVVFAAVARPRREAVPAGAAMAAARLMEVARLREAGA